jgi:hypothetical protein
MSGWQIAKTDRDVVFYAKANSLILGRELGKWKKQRLPGIVLKLQQDGKRRVEILHLEKLQQLFCIGRAFDQNAIGVQFLQGGQQASRTAWAMVADSKNMSRHE